ncbi:MAG: hypothetical protein K0Q79_736 [Flavipsychrobacter sp.]|nr:hypothetical protein [Flavipsychrobacter sp.]
MKKRMYIFCLALSMFCFNIQSQAQRGRSEVAVGYGYWSLFSLTNGTPGNSSGAAVLTFRHYFSPAVTLGLSVGTENIKDYGSFTTFAPELTVKYLDTRNARFRVRLYGAVSYGISIYNDTKVGLGEADASGVKAIGFHGCPLGVRFGRQVAIFTELGVGYKGLFHSGLEVRFPRVLARNRHREE